MTRVVVAVLVFLLSITAASADSLQDLIASANRLAANKRFEEAERVSREAVRVAPASREARIGLANVLLWEGRYREAGELYRRLVRERRNDAEARLGLARSEYWSGDYRRALADFRVIASRDEARRAIAEIESASAPGIVVGAAALSDDQPYKAASGNLAAYVFSDPLTKFRFSIGDARRESGSLHASTPGIGIDVETVVFPHCLTLRGAAAAQRFGDGETRLLPFIAADIHAASTRLTVSASREPLLRTAASLLTHPTAGILSLRWSKDELFAVHAERLRYFDHNNGTGIDGFVLRPIGRFSLGVSAAWRDTDESRFLNGFYIPYYTPQRLREARLVVSTQFTISRATIGVHADGGVGHEAVAGSFHPWRAAVDVNIPLPNRATIQLVAERSSTAFYTSNEIRASLARRF